MPRFIIFFIIYTLLISSSTIHFTLGKPNNETVTESLIQEICSHSRNPSLCIQILTPLKAHKLGPNPLATLGNTAMKMARNDARKTHVTIMSLHAKIKDNSRREVLLRQKQRYYKCQVKFSDVRTRLTHAVLEMKGGNVGRVETNVAIAMNSIDACMDEFNRPPREKSNVVKDVKNVGDVCSVIKAICDHVRHSV